MAMLRGYTVSGTATTAGAAVDGIPITLICFSARLNLHRSYRPQWGRNQGYSHTDRLDSAVESVQSDVEWKEGIGVHS